jgi:hypothetical protein
MIGQKVFDSLGWAATELPIEMAQAVLREKVMQEASDRHNGSTFSHRLFADQVQKQYEYTVFGTAATLINGLIMAFVLRAHVPHMNLIIWLTGAGLVSVSRLVLQRLYNQSATRFSNPEMWNLWFIVTLLRRVFCGAPPFFYFSHMIQSVIRLFWLWSPVAWRPVPWPPLPR